MINGRVFDWESIRIDTPWGIDLPILSISYSSEAPVDPQFSRGNVAVGYGRGNLAQEGAVELEHRSWLQLSVYAATQGGLLRIRPFPITVSYSNEDQVPQIDVLTACVFEKVEAEANQGDTRIGNKKLTIKILDPIKYNGVPVM
jgi:hypothetical protein